MSKCGFSLLLILLCISSNASIRAQPLADGQSTYLGSIINNGSNIPYQFTSLWNQVTPENAGKWGSVEISQDNMDWRNLDLIYQFAQNNDYPFRQHTFVWGQQQPWWIRYLEPDEMRAEVEEWIRLFGERYPDTDFIDVVNEPLHENPSYKDAIGGDGETGWDWVIWSFEKAREYNPTAKLHINDYGVLNGWVSLSNYIKVINLLKERNLIDGIGLQGHFLESTSQRTITSKLDKLAETELPIYITEYDVHIKDDAEQLATYQEQLPALYEHPAVKGLTLWGYVEGQIWREEAFLIHTDGTERPAMQWLREYFAKNTGVSYGTIIRDFHLYPNYPNPFNSATRIRFDLPQSGKVRLTIYDMAGRSLKTLINHVLPAGSHSVQWNARDASGQPLASGIYFCRAEVDAGDVSFTQSRKLLLVR